MKTLKFGISLVAATVLSLAATAGTFKPGEDGEKEIATVSVSKGDSHTFILSGIDSENSAITGWDVYGSYTSKEDGETWTEEFYVFDDGWEENGGKETWYLALSGDDWPDEAPSKVTFHVVLYGWEYDKEDDPQPDREYSFSHEDGYHLPADPEPAIPVGAAENPATLTIQNTLDSPGGGTYVPPEFNQYYFKTTLTAGRKYYFGVVRAADATNSFHLGFTQAGENLFLDETLARSYTNGVGAVEWDDCEQAYVFVPKSTSLYHLVVDCSATSFTLKTAVLPDRKPAGHEIRATLEEGGDPVGFTPGHLNDPASGFYDQVIDECLFEFAPEKGGTYAFETTGADTNLLMRLYDSEGTVIGTGKFKAIYDRNCRVVWTAPSDTTFAKLYSKVYVGVCQRFDHARMADEETEVLGAGPAEITVREVAVENPVEFLTAVQADFETEPPFAEGAEPATNQMLSAGVQTRTYVIAARQGITYQMKAVIRDDTGLLLGAKAYTLNAQKKPVALAASGSIDPASDAPFAFYANANATVYVDVFVDEGDWGDGKGLDYGPFDVYATGCQEGAVFGTLKVEMVGAPDASMTWKLTTPGKATAETVLYPNHASALLPAGSYKITPSTVKGYATPSAASFDIVVSNTFTYVYKYTDTADHLDDYPSGTAPGNKKYAPVSMKPSAKGESFDRSLWGDAENLDPADWFSFKAAEGTYYRFALSGIVGAPKITVYDWDFNAVENVLCEDENAYQISVGEAGKNKTYYVKVAHADEAHPVDSAYTITDTSTSVGSLKFAKIAVSVKKDAASAELTVNRSAKEGKVRVRYSTHEGTAKPGDRYYPASGELVWENGDNKAKTIQVRLIPDETPTYVDGQAVTFSVKLETVAPEEVDIEGGEYLPTISGPDTATVSITETAKKTPGTVTADYAINGTPYAFANPKKPTVTVKRGDKLSLYVRREPGASGANGAVGVEVSAKAGTANKGGIETDYVTPQPLNQIWEDGNTGTFGTFEVQTLPNVDDHTASKAFTINLKALSARPEDSKAKLDKVTLAVSSVAVTIENVATKTVTDFMKDKEVAAALKAEGVTGIKESKAGTWILDASGNLSANVVQTGTKTATADLSFSLAGPGRFTVEPFVAPECEGKMTWGMGTGKTAQGGTCTNGISVVIYVPTGSQTVKFTGLTGCGLTAKDGVAYKWEPLPAVAAAMPTVDKAVVAPGTNELRFEKSEIADVGYAVYILDGAEKKLKLGAPETELKPTEDGEYRTNLVYTTGTAGNKGKYTWRVDSYFIGGTVTNSAKSAWTLTVADDSAVCCGRGLPPTQVTGSDPWGHEIDAIGGTNIVLKQGVKASFAVGGVGSTVKSVTGKIPDGLKLEQDKATKRYYIRGTPSKAGEYAVLLQETDDKKVAGTTTALAFTVDALRGTAAGTFNGLVLSGAPTNGVARAASISFTATAAGKLSANVQIAGKKYSFADTGYTYLWGDRDGDEPILLHAKMSQIQKIGKDSYTNYLHVAVYDRAETDAEAFPLAGMVQLDMNCLPDAKGNGFQEYVTYDEGAVYRDNAKVADWVTAAAKFAGYYTISLVPVSAGYGEPLGHGFITLSADAKGKVKVAGQLADGVSFSASSSACLLGSGFRIPVYYCKGTELIAGWLTLAQESANGDVVAIRDPSGYLLKWYNDDVNSTEWGQEGFAIDLEPVGGWYNTVYNLQRHYLDYAFKVSMPQAEELPLDDKLVDAGYAYVPAIGPDGMPLTVAGNAFSTEKQKLVKAIDPATGRAATYYDWAASVNPQNVQIKYARATGLIKGSSFVLWYERDKTQGQKQVREQKSIAAKPEGVMVLSRAAGGALDDDVIIGGYFTFDVNKAIEGKTTTRKWKASFPFDVRLEYIGNDFTE